jgi:signal transduction histidine kinase
MMEISPPILYELGLLAALEWLTERMADEYSTIVDFKHKGRFDNLPHDFSVLLFQTAREFLINAGKHSSAKKVSVAINGGRTNVEMRVSDNGIGFDISQIGKPTAEGGFGLFGIRERLKSYDGSLVIHSVRGKGTKIRLTIPRMPKEESRREGT